MVGSPAPCTRSSGWAVSPRCWCVEIYRPSGIILILLFLGGYELYRRWRGRDNEASKVYFALQPGQRMKIGTAYLALVAVILIGMHYTYAERHFS